MVRCSIREEFRADTFELHKQPFMRTAGKKKDKTEKIKERESGARAQTLMLVRKCGKEVRA